MKKMLAWCYEAFQRAQQARADREVLARLDLRTLRDIGLDSGDVHLAEREEVQRQRRLLRLAAGRLGTF